jgi:pilus assembly protein Flp/PilA
MLTSFMSLVQALVARVSMMRDESGQALVEYALIIALVAVLCIAALTALSGGISSELSSIVTSL